MGQAIVIFGSTGNLMYKKLIPAIDRLFDKGHIKEDTDIYCIARRDCTLEDYLNDAKEYTDKDLDWERLKKFFTYILFDISDVKDYKALKKRIKADGHDDLITYLAVPPKLFPIIAKGISESGLIEKTNENARIVFEKPFGEDLESAQQINRKLWEYFDESQIYRIDHYLGKEMIQNIMVVRFANSLFQHAWNNKTIESIIILAKEQEGVMTRGGYYDGVGALNDMLQSHLLQMAALTIMDEPISLSSEDIKDSKVEALKHISIKEDDIVLGQYKGYKSEDKVDENSVTETFVYAKAIINGTKLEGVPIHFITGKKLDEKRSEIIVHFKDQVDIEKRWKNAKDTKSMLSIKVAPEEGVTFQFRVKEIGLGTEIIPATLDYCHSCQALENTPEAYERLLLELIQHNRTLFTRWDEIETAWNTVGNVSLKKDPFIYSSYDDILKQLPTDMEEWKDDL